MTVDPARRESNTTDPGTAGVDGRAATAASDGPAATAANDGPAATAANDGAVLMVTPYPPYRDGIAAYAVQEVRELRAKGVDIEVLSPLPSAAKHHLALGGVRGVAALVKRADRYGSVVLQFSPEMLFGACRNPAQRVAVWVGMLALANRTRLEIRLHEIEYGPLERNPAERSVALKVLQAADRLTVHTQREVDELVARIGLDPETVTVVDHGATFAANTELTRQEARLELGLDPDEHIFLSIGFLQEHKGFDQAVEAFGRAGLADGASFHVVGSVRVDHRDLVAYARRLQTMCHNTDGAELHQRYVSDEEFDRWIVAADTIVLPYREIWSSGVLERAKLFRRPVIASQVGGMSGQAPGGTLFFTDVETLVQALKERAMADQPERKAPSGPGESPRPRPRQSPAWTVDAEAPDRRLVEEQIQARVRAQQLAGGSERATAGTAIDPLLSLGPLHRPHAVSARPGVTAVKRLLRRLLGWELDPIVERLDALQRATVESLAELEARTPDDTEEPTPER